MLLTRSASEPLLHRLNTGDQRTIVMVLHDINEKASDRILAMKVGQVAAQGTPHEVVTEDVLRDVFGVEASFISDTRTGAPLVLTTHSLHSDRDSA